MAMLLKKKQANFWLFEEYLLLLQPQKG